MSRSGPSTDMALLSNSTTDCEATGLSNRTGAVGTIDRALSRASSCQCGCPAMSTKARLRRPTHSLRRIWGFVTSPWRPRCNVKPASTNRKFCSDPCFCHASRYPVQTKTSLLKAASGTTRCDLPRLRAIISLARPPSVIVAAVPLTSGAKARSPVGKPIAPPKSTARRLQRCNNAATDS